MRTKATDQEVLLEFEDIKDRFIKKTGRNLIFSSHETRKEFPEVKGKTIRLHDWLQDLPPHDAVWDEFYH